LDLSQVYREHYRSLVRFLYRRIGDQARAEDLAQEAFVRALEHRPERPRAWLFTVAVNLARDEGRRGAVRRRHLELVKGGAIASDPPPGPEAGLEREEAVRRVRAALDRLTERDRDALLMWEEGFSYDEIAESLELARASVGTTLSRARARLAEAYREETEQEGRDEDVAH
jgi:RNA polymerase sigma-70 factor (ECF subfamily)